MSSANYQSTTQPINNSTDQPINNSTNQLINYVLHLADTSLILGHRNSEWTGHGPILEQDIAISNIALDLIGQARNFYQYAADLVNLSGHSFKSEMPAGRPLTEDDLAYLRDEWDFRNHLITELPNGDWAQTILRQFFFSSYQYLLFELLQQSKDQRVAAIAEKSIKETTYHVKWSADWVVRLGDGTDESHLRMNKAIDELWMFTGELFENSSFENTLIAQGFAVDVASLKDKWHQNVTTIFEEATLEIPLKEAVQSGGKNGIHTEYLGYILAEMQHLQRAYPNATW